MRYLTSILFTINVFISQSQNLWDDIRLRKSFYDELDDCLFQYEQYGFLDTEINFERFKDLFTDSAYVEDYLNPEIRKNHAKFVGRGINEFLETSASTYRDGMELFQILELNYDNVTWSNIRLSDRKFYLGLTQQVRALRSDENTLKDEQELQLEMVFDTARYEIVNLRINSIRLLDSKIRIEKKVKDLQVKWSYELGTFASLPIVKAEGLGMRAGEIDSDLVYGLFDNNENPIQLRFQNDFIAGFGGSIIRKLKQLEGRELSMSIGLRYELGRYHIRAAEVQSAFSDSDSSDDFFIHTVVITDLDERVQFNFLKFPLRLRLEREIYSIPLFQRLNVFSHIGANFNYLFNSQFTKRNGLIDHSALYPQFGNAFISQDVPELGLLRDSTTQFHGNYDFRDFDTELVFSGGISFPIVSPWHLYISLDFNLGLLNLASQDLDHLPSQDYKSYDGVGQWLDQLKFRSLSVNFIFRRKFKIKERELTWSKM